MQPNKINLMIESDRQKIARQSQSGSAAMARFVDSIHLFLVEFILQGVPLLAERSDATYIYKGTPCAHLSKKVVFLI